MKNNSCFLITEQYNQVLDLFFKGLSHKSLFWTLQSVASIVQQFFSEDHCGIFGGIPLLHQQLCEGLSPASSGAPGKETGKDGGQLGLHKHTPQSASLTVADSRQKLIFFLINKITAEVKKAWTKWIWFEAIQARLRESICYFLAPFKYSCVTCALKSARSPEKLAPAGNPTAASLPSASRIHTTSPEHMLAWVPLQH